MYQLYGIANCDTVKKARKKLESLGVEFEFVDFKKQAPSQVIIKRWKKAFGGEWPLNKKGRTYRQLKDEIESMSASEMPAYIAENTSLIKRPVLEKDGKVLSFGYDEEVLNSLS